MHHTLQALRNEPPESLPKKRIKPRSSVVIYPDRDGKPMSDNTKQFRWIVKIKEGLEILFRDNPDVFVAGDLLWYPVEGSNKIRIAPDAMVVFGRPKGDRGSYRQWEEKGIAPQAVFEVLSPGNTPSEMGRKLKFYEKYGVEEYYLYDPDSIEFKGWLRSENRLCPLENPKGWVSPRLNIRFEILPSGKGKELVIFRPDGKRFLLPSEIEERAVRAELNAEQGWKIAQQERQRAEKERQRAELLEAKLRALGVEI